MGGIGSGRGPQGGRDITGDHRSLDVRRFQREGLLAPGRVFGWNWKCDGEVFASISIRTITDQVILSYRHRTGQMDWTPEVYPVRLDWTPCTYGGRRPWFLCPVQGCGRRVVLLYLGMAGLFVCRHCCRLAYACQRETVDERTARRAETIRRRLGWEAGILNLPGGRPKGMHGRTFDRLKHLHDAFVETSTPAWPDGCG